MRLARHDGLRVAIGLGNQRVHDVEHSRGNVADRVAHPHAEQGGHLVIAGTARAQAAADLGANAINQAALHRTVDVLVARLGAKGSVGHVLAKLLQAGDEGIEVLVAQQVGLVQHPRVSLRGQHVVGSQNPVEVRGLRQGGHRLSRSAGESAAPQGAFVRAVCLGGHVWVCLSALVGRLPS